MKIWSLHGDGKSVAPGEVVAPSERLNWPATIAIGVQHVVAMFGATFLVPVLTGFPVPTTLLFSGVGTLLFLIITRNKLPSYLGSSFAFIAPVTAATASAGMGSALAGIVAVGILLAIVGVIANVTGTGWITGHYDPQNPDVITGTFTEQRGDHTYVVSLNLRRGAPPEKEKHDAAAHPPHRPDPGLHRGASARV